MEQRMVVVGLEVEGVEVEVGAHPQQEEGVDMEHWQPWVVVEE